MRWAGGLGWRGHKEEVRLYDETKPHFLEQLKDNTTMAEQSQTSPKALSEHLRDYTAGWMRAIGEALQRAGVQADAVSVLGLGLVAMGAVLVCFGRLAPGGWLILLGSLLDAVDGAVARAWAQQDPFGAVLDSALDRYADGFIFASLSYYFASQNQTTLMLLPLAGLAGSYAVSYVRARADGPDVRVAVKVGLFSRFERLTVIVWALWFHGWLLLPGLWLLAVGTNVTAVQRLWFVRKHTRK